ncbi:DUF6113 family protein [Streptomyces sp. WAC06614]|uniref:DUF6113 family protein n=1 Tax=Streptomyces sp. WAC06614 TaxID=2487416 RepID=UPI000F7ACFF8|nr:DUF6113 family protein [Streptomyces sp. WAC06614]RSS54582.1 hypothetical protein EF918_34840 [Streptomyces sp. WAC06614]
MSTPWTPARILVCLGLLVAGWLAGTAGWLVVDVWFPGGLVLALLALWGVFLAGRLLTGTALGVGAAVLGWFLAYVVLSLPRSEGDFLLSPAAISMYVYLLGGTALAVMCATLQLPPDRPVSATRSGR